MSMSMRSLARAAALLVPALMAGAASAEETLCELPGVTVLEDAGGDVMLGFVEQFGDVPAGLPLDFADLISVQVAQPPADDGVAKLVFTIKLGAAPVQLPPSAAWFVSFDAPDRKVHGVRMETDQSGAPTFYSYVASPAGLQGEGETDGRFVEEGSAKPAEAGSSISGDTITIVVLASNVAVRKAGDKLSGFNGAMVQSISVSGVGGFADTLDQMPDDLGRRGEIETTENEQCTAESKIEQILGGSLGGLLLLPLVLVGALRRVYRQ